jgi:hypothetical protein
MFQYGMVAGSLMVEHQHADGSWAALEPREDARDPAELDPERDWNRGHVYVCPRCGETVRVSVTDDRAAPTPDVG